MRWRQAWSLRLALSLSVTVWLPRAGHTHPGPCNLGFLPAPHLQEAWATWPVGAALASEPGRGAAKLLAQGSCSHPVLFPPL